MPAGRGRQGKGENGAEGLGGETTKSWYGCGVVIRCYVPKKANT